MKWKITVFSLCFIYAGFADEPSPENLFTRQEHMQKKTTNDSVVVNRNVTPSARGCPNREQGIFFSAEFLYWEAVVDNLRYATQIDTTLVSGRAVTEEKGLVQSFDWSPGVRGSIGYNLPYCAWDLQVIGTYLHSNPSALKVTRPTQTLVMSLVALDTSSASTETDLAQSVDGSWKFDFYAIDQEIGRPFYVNESLIFRPFGGVKAAWLRQDVDVQYGNVLVVSGAGSRPTRIRAENHFWGIGPRLGVETRYLFPDYLGMFFDTSFAFLYGKFDIQSIFTDFVFDGVAPLQLTFNEDEYRLSPTAQLQAGLDTKICFSKNRYFFALKVGYECQFWWNQERFFFNPDLAAISTPGDLFMHGLFVQTRFDF